MKALGDYLGKKAEAKSDAVPQSSPYACCANNCFMPGQFADSLNGPPRSVCWVHDGAPYDRWPLVTQAMAGLSRWTRLYGLLVTREGRVRLGIEDTPGALELVAKRAASELGEPILALQDSDYLTQRWVKGASGPSSCREPSWYRYAGRLRKLIRERAGVPQ
jgi:hypothetical protein